MSLKGKNVVITGATRGIGRGLALAFGEQGANVYITGRNPTTGPDSLSAVSDLVRKAGGNCDYFVVDHSDDDAIARLFQELQTKLGPQTLDVFINNAYAAVNFIDQSMNLPFWLKSADQPSQPDPQANPGKVWDLINGVGLRNNYICFTRAVRIMDTQRSGILINITSWAGISTLFDPVYSIGKEALDRMSAEIALSLPPGVQSFAFCPGFVTTENLLRFVEKDQIQQPQDDDSGPYGSTELPMWNAETPLFVGRSLAALLTDKGARILKTMNGKVVMAAEVAEILDVYDENDFRPLSFRSIRFHLMSMIPFLQTSFLRKLIPRTLYAPWFIVRSVAGATQYW